MIKDITFLQFKKKKRLWILLLPTPCTKWCFEDEIRDVTIHDPHKHEVHVETLDAHPSQRWQREEVQQPCHDATRNDVDFDYATLGVESDHGQEGDVETEQGEAETE